MGEILIGAVVLVVLLALLRLFVTADSKALVKVFRYVGALLLLAVALFLFLTERIGAAVFVVSMAWGLFTGGHVWPGGWPYYRFPGGGESDQSPPQKSGMSRAEALKVLGLDEGATEDDIRAAHKRLMMQNHPDRGGSNYLASKINEAKDVLLGD